MSERRLFGRTKEKEIFKASLINPLKASEHRLVVYYGVGGQGKSSLISYFLDKIQDQNNQTFSEWSGIDKSRYYFADLSFQSLTLCDPVEALTSIRAQLGKDADIARLRDGSAEGGDLRFYNFDLALAYYLKTLSPNVDIRQRYPELFRNNELVKGILEIFGAPSLITDRIDKVLDQLNPDQRLWYQTDGRTLENQLRNLRQEQIINNLPSYLGKDLSGLSQKPENPRMVILFDTYEALSPIEQRGRNADSSDKWIRDLVASSTGIIFGIFGREKLNWQRSGVSGGDRDFVKLLENNQHFIEGLGSAEALLFLESEGISNPEIQNKIVASSQGLPFYLDLQLRIYQEISQVGNVPTTNDFGGTEWEIIGNFLKHLNDDEENALYVLAQVRQVDESLFEFLKQNHFINFSASFARLVNRSFFEHNEQNDNYYLHQVMQKHLATDLKSRDTNRFFKIHQAMFEYYDSKAVVVDLKAITAQQVEALQNAAYHKLILEETVNFGDDQENYVDWLRKRSSSFESGAYYLPIIPLFQTFLEQLPIPEKGPIDNSPFLLDLSFWRQHSALISLGELFRQSGQIDSAEAILIEAVKVANRLVGNEFYPIHGQSCNSLALLYHDMGRIQEALPLYLRAKELAHRAQAENQASYAAIINNIAGIYVDMNQPNDAIPLYLESLEIDKELGKLREVSYQRTLGNLARAYHFSGQFELAEEKFLKAIKLAKELLGELNPQYANTLDNYALLLKSQKRLKDAADVFKQILNIAKNNSINSHPIYAHCFQHYFRLLMEENQTEDAIKLQQEIVSLNMAIYGLDSFEVAQSLKMLGSGYIAIGDLDNAEKTLLEAKERLQKGFSSTKPEHPSYALCLADLSCVYREQNDLLNAKVYIEGAIEIAEKTMSPDAKEIQIFRRNYENLLLLIEVS